MSKAHGPTIGRTIGVAGGGPQSKSILYEHKKRLLRDRSEAEIAKVSFPKFRIQTILGITPRPRNAATR